jgi:hypothetical protein
MKIGKQVIYMALLPKVLVPAIISQLRHVHFSSRIETGSSEIASAAELVAQSAENRVIRFHPKLARNSN